MDENFFFKAMRAVGIPTYIVDEIEDKPMTENDIQILSKEYYQAREDYPCAWADDGHTIYKGRRYVRVVVKPSDGPFQTQRVCLNCWVKP